MRYPTALLALTLALAGCEEDPPAPKRSLPATATMAAPAASATASATGVAVVQDILSEEGFKALHELKGDAAPAPEGEMVSLADGSKAYLSLPAGEPPLPAVIVIHEWWGLNGHIKHWSDRLAKEGYAALAVDLYGGKVADNGDDAQKYMKAVDAEAAKKTLLTAFAFLAEDDRIKAEKRASIGWCFGGKWSLELALAAPELSAAVVYYGHVESDPARLAKLESPLLAIFGNEDQGIPPKTVDAFEFGLEQAGEKNYRILRYDAEHAFANPSSARYDAPAAEQAWSEVRSFLAAELKGRK